MIKYTEKAKPESIWDERGQTSTDIENGLGALCTVEHYIRDVASGCLIDYDGFGLAVKILDNEPPDSKYGHTGEAIVKPSKCPDDIPPDATHVLWFNR